MAEILTPEQFRKRYGGAPAPAKTILTPDEFKARYGNALVNPQNRGTANGTGLTGKTGRIKSVEDLAAGLNRVDVVEVDRHDIPPSPDIARLMPQPMADPEPETVGDPLRRGVQNMVGALGEAALMNPIAERLTPHGLGRMAAELASGINPLQSLERDTQVAKKLSDNVKAWAEKTIPAKPPTGKYAKPPDKFLDYVDPARIYQVTAENAPLMGAFVASTLANPAAGAALMFGVEGGSAKSAMLDWEKKTGQKINPIYREAIPVIVGAVNAALEKTGIGEILKVGKAAGLKGKLLQAAISTITEGGTEGAQEITQILAESGYQGKIPEDAGQRFTESLYAGLLLGLGGSGISALAGREKQVATAAPETMRAVVTPTMPLAPAPAASQPVATGEQVSQPAPPAPVATTVPEVEIEDQVRKTASALKAAKAAQSKVTLAAPKEEALAPVEKSPAPKDIGGGDVATTPEAKDLEAAKVFNVPMAAIATDVDRFQNRDTDFSERTAQEVAENFDPNKFDPIVLWRDPENSKTYVISGHSRFEGMKRRGEANIPARYFQGDERAAINFARLEANRLGASETFGETLKAYRAAKEQQYTAKQMKSTFGSDVDFLNAVKNLNPSGDFVKILSQPAQTEFPYIRNFSRWIGEARETYGDKFTNAHEDQIFKFLYADVDKNRRMGKDDFLKLLDKNFGKADWDASQPLTLRRGDLPVTGTRARSDTKEAMAEIDELRERQKVTKTVEEYQALQDEIENKLKKVSEVVQSQPDLFADIQDELFEYAQNSGERVRADTRDIVKRIDELRKQRRKTTVLADAQKIDAEIDRLNKFKDVIIKTQSDLFADMQEDLFGFAPLEKSEKKKAAPRPAPPAKSADLFAEKPATQPVVTTQAKLAPVATTPKPDAPKNILQEAAQKVVAAKKPQGMTRAQFVEALRALVPKTQIRTGEIDLAIKITDAIAKRWAEWNNSTPEKFYGIFGALSTDEILSINTDNVDEWRKVLAKLAKAEPRISGATSFDPATGLWLIRLFEHSNFSNLVHEIGHVLRRQLPESDVRTIKLWADGENSNPNEALSKSGEEKFARAWERYLLEGKAPNSALQEIFAKLKQFLGEIYAVIRKPGLFEVEINDDVRRVMDNLFSGEQKPAPQKAKQANPFSRVPPDGWTEADRVPEKYRKLVSGDTEKKPEAPKPNILQQAASAVVAQKTLAADIAKTKFGGMLSDGRKLMAKNIASRKGAEGLAKGDPKRLIVGYTDKGVERFAVIEGTAAQPTAAQPDRPVTPTPVPSPEVTHTQDRIPDLDARQKIAFTPAQLKADRNAVLPTPEQKAWAQTPYQQALLNAVGGNVPLAKKASRRIGEMLPDNFIESEEGRRGARIAVSHFVMRDEDVSKVYAELVQAFQRGEDVGSDAAPVATPPTTKPIYEYQYYDLLPSGHRLLAKNLTEKEARIKFSPKRGEKIVSYNDRNGNLKYAIVKSDAVETTTETALSTSPAPEPTPSQGTQDAREVLPGTRRLIEAIKAAMRAGIKLDNPKLTEFAERAFRGTRQGGRFTSRDAYDALEVAVNELIAEERPEIMREDLRSALTYLRTKMDILPRQTDRTDEQIKFQQFSTPPTQAYIAAKMLNPRAGEFVLEPSAGTGDLALYARLAGATVRTNEIADRRKGLLEMQGYPVTQVDAAIINDTLPYKDKPTAIIMNPPFSSSGGKTAKNKTEYGARHVESALARLENGGRLVAIVGEGMGLDSFTFAAWFEKLSRKYHIRANVKISGDEFAKYGTNFGNRILVFDKTGATPGDTWAAKIRGIERAEYKTLEEVINVTDKLAATRPQVGEKKLDSQRQRPVAETTGNIRERAGDAAGEIAGRGRVTEFTRPSGRSAEPSQRTRPVQGDEPVSRVEPGVESVTTRPTESTARGGVSGRVAEDVQPIETAAQAGEITAVEREQDTEKFVTYAPTKLGIGEKHPARIVESSSMAAVDLPDITYKTALPPEIIKEGKLSGLQLESVYYAGQQFEKPFINGKRSGFFIGDGTGVGKGRQIAGIITDQWQRGVRRVLWVSAGRDLQDAAAIDFSDLGQKNKIAITSLNDFPTGEAIAMPQGVVFCTYSSLIGQSQKGKGLSRQKQLEDWLGNDCCIVFDEAHKAKNALASGPGGEPTKTATAVIGIQDNLPGARVIYSSATGATDVRNMAYMTRLGLWGEGTPFPGGFLDFLQEIENGGVGAMEMVARDMKALGMYVSRSISYQGVGYKEVTHTMTPEQRHIYNTAATAWQRVFQNIDEAIEITGAGPRQRAFAMSRFWSEHQRFFKQLLTAIKVPTCIKEVEQSVAEGKAVIISLIGTGEARTNDLITKAIADDSSLDDLDFSPRETIAHLVEKSFPTTVYEEVDDELTGKPIKVMVKDADGNPLQSQEALDLKTKLLDSLTDLNLPENPLDQIVNYFGPNAVAEMTGRKRRLIRNKAGNLEYVKRAPDDVAMNKTNLHEKDLFQSGKKNIAIISDAASTGISLHSSNRAQNKRRRYQIALELGWSADKQMQTFGRSHRSDQSEPPEFGLLSTDAGGEKRFSSTIAKRLGSLGALTKGEREATGGVDLAKYNFETDEGKAALVLFYHHAMENTLEGVDQPRVVLKQMGILKERKDGSEDIEQSDNTNVPRFLNRILALDIDTQNATFGAYTRIFDDVVKTRKESGTFDDGVQDIRGEHILIVGTPEVVNTDANTGAETRHYTVQVETKVEPVTWNEASRRSQVVNAGFTQNIKSKNVFLLERVAPITDQASGKVKGRVKITNPQRKSRIIFETELVEKFDSMQPGNAKVLWDEAVKAMPLTIKEQKHIIGGAILPIWGKLKTQGMEQSMKVVRVNTDDKKRIVGVLLPDGAVGGVLRSLGVSRAFSDPDEIFNAVLENGETIPLQGGFTIKRSYVHRERTIEVTGGQVATLSLFQKIGLRAESIDYKKRFFISTDKRQGVGVIKRLIERYPPAASAESVEEKQADPLYDLIETVDESFTDATVKDGEDLKTAIESQPTEDEVEVFADIVDISKGKYEFAPDIEKRWKASHGVKPISIFSKIADLAEKFRNQATREFEHLPSTAEFSRLRFDLSKLQKQKPIASTKAVQRLQEITDKLTPENYDIFERLVILNDLAHEAEAGHALPFGFTPATLSAEHRRLLAAASSRPAIADAARQRKAVWDDLKADYIAEMSAIGMNVDSRFNKEDYFRHQVLMYANAKGLTGTGKKLRTPANRGFLKQRGGSSYDINSNYLQAEFEVVSQMLYDIEVAKTIAGVDRNYNIAPELQDQAKKQKAETGEKVDWHDLIPEGYTTWQPREGNVFYLADSIPSRLAQALQMGELESLGITKNDFRQVLAVGGPRREFVVKDEVAATLDELLKEPKNNVIGEFSKTVLDKWKAWTLLSPRRAFKYNTRNLIGDADVIFAGNPSAFKKLPQAINELTGHLLRGKTPSAEMERWIERGGMQANLQVTELHEVDKLKEFDKLAEKHGGLTKIPEKIFKGYWNGVRLLTDMRESILRYAAYLDYLDQMKQSGGKPKNFGASIPEEVTALKNFHDKAYKLSNELLGAYDQVSVIGQYIRNHIFPFWSFKEVNFRRYLRLMKNAAQDGRLAEAVGRKLLGTIPKSPYIAMRVGAFAIKATALWSVLQVWNKMFFPDEEDDLPEDTKARPHIIFGRDKDGKVIYFDRLGSLGDFLEWFGLDDAPDKVSDFALGRKTLREIATDMAKAPVNVVTKGVRPEMKLPAELAAGQSYFPDVFKPSVIRDNGLHIARSLGIDQEYIAIKKLPSRGYGNSAELMFYYKSDPGETAYYRLYDEKMRFLKKIGKYGEFGGQISAKSNALYNLRLALRYQDKDAVDKYIAEYAALGGDKQGLKTSLRYFHPLNGLGEHEDDFVRQLSADDRDKLKEAIKFYDTTLSEKAQVGELLRQLPDRKRKGKNPIPAPVQ